MKKKNVVLNGEVGDIKGEKEMKEKVGEKVMIIKQKEKRDKSKKMIGGNGDYVWEKGKLNKKKDVEKEKWLIKGGEEEEEL